MNLSQLNIEVVPITTISIYVHFSYTNTRGKVNDDYKPNSLQWHFNLLRGKRNPRDIFIILRSLNNNNH